jgi:acetyltransferase-like isoleucine patch superfamily enzyme
MRMSKPIIIEDNVWIGESVSILPGVRIGRGSVIGSNSVVTRSVPAYSIAAGCPAKTIKKYDRTSNAWLPV